MSSVGLSQCTLTVLESPAVHDPNLTTFRFYINLENANDQVSAIWGDNYDHLVIHAPQGVFNSAFNSSWNASGINPVFVAVFPEVADDTYATIGLDGPAATSSLEAAVDPTIVEDEAQPITPFFVDNGATELVSNSHIGSAWYVLNTASNGLPDENLQVIILQVTTAGGISGKINYQVFPLGVGENAEYYSVEFDGTGTFGGDGTGCTDLMACNFDAQATEDDGSCTYIPEGDCDCDGNVLDALGVCGGYCLADSNGDGICDGDEVLGCINDSACNYNPDANLPDPEGPCAYPEPGFCCDGSLDVDEDGICDEDEIAGCTDPFACNYDSAATDEDGTCEYCGCSDEAYTLTVESAPAIQAGLTTYRLYVNMNGENDFLSAVYGVDDQPLQINAPEGAFNSEQSLSWSAAGVNPGLFIAYPELQDDSYATIGLSVSAALLNGTEQDPALTEGSGNEVFHFFTTDGATSLASSEFLGSSWYVLAGASNGFADAQGRVLIMQVTTAGSLSGTLSYQIFADGNQGNDLYVTSSFHGVGTFGQTNVCGCMEANACNYDEAATIDDDSCEYESCDGCMDSFACNYDWTAELDNGTNCIYPEIGYNCDGTCVDLNNNGICDFIEVAGCTIPLACNFNMSANIDDGSCLFNDADNDGVCDGNEVFGCLDAFACNFDPSVTENDFNLCDYETCAGCLDPAACNFDGTAVIDYGCEYASCSGCTQEEACNYDPEASIDNGSCDFFECLGCTDPESCNFDAEASVDDGSCDGLALHFEVVIDECPNPLAVVVVQDASPWSGTLQLSSEGVNVFEEGGVAIAEIEGVPFELTQGETYLVSGISDSGCEQSYPLHIPYGRRPITPYPSARNDNGNVPGAVTLDSIKGGTPPFNTRWFRVTEDPFDLDSTSPWGTLLFESQLDALDPGLYRIVAQDAAGCVADSVVEVLDEAVYACLDSDAYNFDPEGTVDNGNCIYFEEDCEFIEEDYWQFLPQGIYPNDTTFWFLGDPHTVDLVLSLPTFLTEPAGTTFLSLHWTLNSVSGLPDGLSVNGLVDSLLGGAQDCFQIEGAPLTIDTYVLTLSGDLVVQFFGAPLQIDNYQFTHTIQVLPNPNPIPGCTYPFAWNFLAIADLDDGSCLIPGCADSNACNYQPLASFDGVMVCDYSCLGCTYNVALNYSEGATRDDGSCLFDSSSADCLQDLSGDNNIGSSDLLVLLSEFGIPCTP